MSSHIDTSAILPEAMAGATPVMQQFLTAKARHPDALIFFRMGDFYELFFEDAQKAAEVLGIALTYRGKYAGEDIPMAGVPFHAMEPYLAKLIRSGFRVAICEQMESPAEAKKRGYKAIVHREVIRVITPGTLTEEALLETCGANWLSALVVRENEAALAAVELSTGEVVSCPLDRSAVLAHLSALAPKEILVLQKTFETPELSQMLQPYMGALHVMPQVMGDFSACEAKLKRLYGVRHLSAFGELSRLETIALGMIAAHLDLTQAGRIPALDPPKRQITHETLLIDPSTRASLEIDRTLSGQRRGSLLDNLDKTLTPQGARMLNDRLMRPLTDRAAINARLDCVELFFQDRHLRETIREILKGCGDMARSLSRLVLGRGGPRDLGVLRKSLGVGEEICAQFSLIVDPTKPLAEEISQALLDLNLSQNPPLAHFFDDLKQGLAEDLPGLVRDGGFVAKGFRPELDEIRHLTEDSRRTIARLESDLQKETGINLKIRHNNVLGYFIDTTAKQAETLLSPPLSQRFFHRQTTANQVRFTTEELTSLDARIAQAADRISAIETEVFQNFRNTAESLALSIRTAAQALARLDVAAALAQWAKDKACVRPVLEETASFDLRLGRHPVVEEALRQSGRGGSQGFTPNDCSLEGAGGEEARIAILTGPNMSGKSTFLRQNALLIILAQAGSFVPAEAFRLGLVDRLFSRVGAGDDLARGLSTFMMEMVETAAILIQATPKSFVILDEIGRGTATYDGLAIAWATVEALHETNRCRTLFATHYHELAELEYRLAHVKTLSLQAKEWEGNLVFLHQVQKGVADRSYGVQVARLAGMPKAVVARALEVLKRLEKANGPLQFDDLPLFQALGTSGKTSEIISQAPESPVLSENPILPENSILKERLQSINPDLLSAKQALDILYELKGLI